MEDYEFRVSVERGVGKPPLGLKMRMSSSQCKIEVKSMTQGVVQEWNDAKPGSAVMVSDLLVEVNGTRRPTSCAIMESDEKLELVFFRQTT